MFPQAKKSFGQHFLKDRRVMKKIVDALEVKAGERVLEIGPGRGALTRALIEAGADVVAVEADRDLIPILREQFGDSLTLVKGDILKQHLPRIIESPYKLASNLPYNIASAVVEQFLSSSTPPRRMVVMVQREVGERMIARPGDMGLLSVACQIYADITRVTRVLPGAFSPPPKVESLVVRLDYAPKTTHPERVIALAKFGFASKRQQLQKNLARAHVAASEDTKKALEFLGRSLGARAQELSVEDWIQLASLLM